METKKKDRFNAELLRAHLEKNGCSQRELATQVGVSHTTIQNWLRGGLPGRENLRKLGEVFDVDPHDFLADPFDLLYSYGMTFAYKVFLMERRGEYGVKVSLSALVRLLKELGVFQEPPDAGLDLPESVLQGALPKLEERAREEAKIMQMADENFLKNFVAENREKIEALLAQDIPTV